MGGAVNVAIRFSDGSTVCQERWTNVTPWWLCHPKVFSRDESHLREFVEKGQQSLATGGWGDLSPVQNSEYGLIVIDMMTNHFLDNNGYSTFNQIHPIHLDDKEDERYDNFINFAIEGRLRTQTWYSDKSRETEISDILSVKEAEELVALYFEQSRERYSFSIPSGTANERKTFRFLIDTAPFQYIKFPELDTKKYRKKLREIGFPMNRKTGLNKGF